MNPRATAPLLILAAVAAGCAARPSVPVAGSPLDVASLAGDWAGEYSSATTGRSGVIEFSLTATADTAHGVVVMTPTGAERPLEPIHLPDMDPHHARYEVLHVDFLFIQDDVVRGRLAPYRDPVCGCALFTEFEGTLVGDRIEGTFATRGADGGHDGHEADGTWFVTR
jgi:hypothetical protein